MSGYSTQARKSVKGAKIPQMQPNAVKRRIAINAKATEANFANAHALLAKGLPPVFFSIFSASFSGKNIGKNTAKVKSITPAPLRVAKDIKPAMLALKASQKTAAMRTAKPEMIAVLEKKSFNALPIPMNIHFFSRNNHKQEA